MAAARVREAIKSPDLAQIAGLDPLAGASGILGVRVFDVGQGDSIAVLALIDGQQRNVLQLDYGGRQGSPFSSASDIDARMPVAPGQLLMLTHWDEDHWCTAKKGNLARNAMWLVPRQVTSPRAALFSTTLGNIRCIPERWVGQQQRFDAPNGDYILWEKIGSFAGTFAKDEDCNATGVALALVRRRSDGEDAILLPGDAPFGKVGMFAQLAASGVRLRGVVAFHHGAGAHWTDATEQLLKDWVKCGRHDGIFSCSDPNSYDHPDEATYKALLPRAKFWRTAVERSKGRQHVDLLF